MQKLQDEIENIQIQLMDEKEAVSSLKLKIKGMNENHEQQIKELEAKIE